jgi:hypothetical protein
MPWTSVLWLIARVALRVLADDLDPAGRRRRPRKGASRPKASQSKQAPPQPKKEQARPRKAPSEPPKRPPQAEPSAPNAAPQSAESAGWGARTEPPAVTVLHIETDEGSTVSPLSFIGDQVVGATRVQRERKPGESRRVRRTARAEETRPVYTPEMQAGIERMRARARGLEVVYPKPAAPPRRRPAGGPLAIAHLAPATLLLLASGEPLSGAAAAA